MSETRVFPSRVDRWLVVVVTLSMGAGLLISLASFIPGPVAVAALTTAFMAVMCAFVAHVFTTTRYTVDHELLLIRSGPFRWKIPLEEIRAIRPTHNLLSSPALSLDRLDVLYGNGQSIRISPKDKAGFLDAIAERVPGLVVAVDRLERSPLGDDATCP